MGGPRFAAPCAPTSPSPQAPRGELFADSGAAAVWAAIQLLSEESRRELLDAFVAEQIIPDLRGSKRQAQVARALALLRDAQELLVLEARQTDVVAEEPPRLSVDSYRRLYQEHGRRLGWPPDGTMRSWLAGSWNDCLRAAGLEIVPDGDALVRELGGALTPEECLSAVREYAREMEIELPPQTGYVRWAGSTMVRRRPGRRPMSQGPFDRLFANWGDVLVQAGIAEPDAVGGVGRSIGRTDSGGRTVYLRSGYCYSDEQLHGALREIADRLGHSPKTTEYRGGRARGAAGRRGRLGAAPARVPVAVDDPEALRILGRRAARRRLGPGRRTPREGGQHWWLGASSRPAELARADEVQLIAPFRGLNGGNWPLANLTG